MWYSVQPVSVVSGRLEDLDEKLGLGGLVHLDIWGGRKKNTDWFGDTPFEHPDFDD